MYQGTVKDSDNVTMRNVPNDIVSSLIRLLPVIIESADTSGNKVYNAVRQTRKILKRLIRIENEQRGNDRHIEPSEGTGGDKHILA